MKQKKIYDPEKSWLIIGKIGKHLNIGRSFFEKTISMNETENWRHSWLILSSKSILIDMVLEHCERSLKTSVK